MTSLVSAIRTTLLSAAVATAGAIAGQSACAAGLMTPAGQQYPQLEIRSHHVEVTIEDGYAVTAVEQSFHNPNDMALEAIYSFPVPEKASVGEFTYWIDGKPVTAEVLEKQQAREVYEQEKAQGRETALVEQDDYRTFDSAVYPVQPHADVRIRLVYIQPVHADLGVGRYVYPLEEGGVDEERLSFWTYDEEVTESFSFELRLRSSYPLDAVHVPGNAAVQVTRVSENEWQVSYAAGNANQENAGEESASEENIVSPEAGVSTGGAVATLGTDLVVYWRHAQELPGSVNMVSYREPGAQRGTFMMTVTPGDDLGTVTSGRDWVFVLDMSGSMQGKFHSLVQGVRQGLGKLNPNDRFRIVLFNDRVRDLTRGFVPVRDDTVATYMRKLDSTTPDNGTNLYAGVDEGLRGLDADRPSAIILVTDGVANVGVTERKEFLRLLDKRDVRLFSFVMGNSANRPLLEGMSKISNGFAMNISNSDEIGGRLVQVAGKLTHEAYRDVEVEIDGIRVRDMTPERIGSLYRGQQLIVFGHYWGSGPADVRITGSVGAERRSYSTRFDFPESSTLNPEIERLWAYASIEDLQGHIDYLGEDADTRSAIVDIALEHGLVTNYTSMVVVREEVYEQLGIERRNDERVKRERNAREQRSLSPVRDSRKDYAVPAFSQSQARSSSGGGAFGPWGLFTLLPLAAVIARHRRSTGKGGA